MTRSNIKLKSAIYAILHKNHFKKQFKNNIALITLIECKVY